MAKKKFKEMEVPEANLLPVMNIMFLLIPGLLLAMEVASMAAITVSPPQFAAAAENQNQDEKKEKPLDLKVMIKNDGFFISSSSQQEGAEAGASQQSDLPTIGLLKPGAPMDDYERYDYAKLLTKAKEYKAAFKNERIVKINAEADIPMQVLVTTMDHLRGTECKFANHPPDEPPPPECLFDQVIIEPTN